MKPIVCSRLAAVFFCAFWSCSNDDFSNPNDPISFVTVAIQNVNNNACQSQETSNKALLVDVDENSHSVRIEADKIVSLELAKGQHIFRTSCENGVTIDSIKVIIQGDTTVAFTVPCGSCISTLDGLLIDDFDSAADSNALGYCKDIFLDNLGPEETNLARIDIEYANESENVLRRQGRSLRIIFDVSERSNRGGAFGGYVELLTANNQCSKDRGAFNLDALNFRFLTFWVRTDESNIDFEIALKDTAGNQTTPKLLIQEFLIPKNVWQKAKIPIQKLVEIQASQVVDLKSLREISFGFSLDHFGQTTARKGIVYIDEVAFER